MFSAIAKNSRQTVFKVFKTRQLQIGKFQNACRRSIHQSHVLQETVKVTYIDSMGDSHIVDAEVGKNLLDIAHDNDLELEGEFIAMCRRLLYTIEKNYLNKLKKNRCMRW